jgi:hypothetical protein
VQLNGLLCHASIPTINLPNQAVALDRPSVVAVTVTWFRSCR